MRRAAATPAGAAAAQHTPGRAAGFSGNIAWVSNWAQRCRSLTAPSARGQRGGDGSSSSGGSGGRTPQNGPAAEEDALAAAAAAAAEAAAAAAAAVPPARVVRSSVLGSWVAPDGAPTAGSGYIPLPPHPPPQSPPGGRDGGLEDFEAGAAAAADDSLSGKRGVEPKGRQEHKGQGQRQQGQRQQGQRQQGQWQQGQRHQQRQPPHHQQQQKQQQQQQQQQQRRQSQPRDGQDRRRRDRPREGRVRLAEVIDGASLFVLQELVERYGWEMSAVDAARMVNKAADLMLGATGPRNGARDAGGDDADTVAAAAPRVTLTALPTPGRGGGRGAGAAAAGGAPPPSQREVAHAVMDSVLPVLERLLAAGVQMDTAAGPPEEAAGPRLRRAPPIAPATYAWLLHGWARSGFSPPAPMLAAVAAGLAAAAVQELESYKAQQAEEAAAAQQGAEGEDAQAGPMVVQEGAREEEQAPQEQQGQAAEGQAPEGSEQQQQQSKRPDGEMLLRRAITAVRTSAVELNTLGFADAGAWRAVARAAIALVPHMHGREAATLARAFAKAGPDAGGDFVLFAALAQPIHAATEDGSMDARGITDALWAYGEALQPDRQLLTALGAGAAALAHGLNLSRAHCALHGFARTRVPAPAQLQAAIAATLPGVLRGAPPRQLAQLAWCVARVAGGGSGRPVHGGQRQRSNSEPNTSGGDSGSGSEEGDAFEGGRSGGEEGKSNRDGQVAAAGTRRSPLLSVIPLIFDEARTGGPRDSSPSAAPRGLARFTAEELCTLLWACSIGRTVGADARDDARAAAEARLLDGRGGPSGELRRLRLVAVVQGFYSLAVAGAISADLARVLLPRLRSEVPKIARNGWLCSHTLGALAHMRCQDPGLVAAIADELVGALQSTEVTPQQQQQQQQGRRQQAPQLDWNAADAVATAHALAELAHGEQQALVSWLLDCFTTARHKGTIGGPGGAGPRAAARMARACAVLGLRDASGWRQLLKLLKTAGPEMLGANGLGQLQQGVMYLQLLMPDGAALADTLPEPLTTAAAAAWAAAATANASPSAVQGDVAGALRRLGLDPRLEALVGGGLFSADIALDYAGAPVVVEVCGPTHFLVPASALEAAAGLGRVAGTRDQPFGEALVVAAAGLAAARAAALDESGGGGGSAGAFYISRGTPGGGEDGSSSSADSGGTTDDSGEGLLLLDGPDRLRSALIEASGWRVAHLPWHLWVARGSDDALLASMLEHAVGANPAWGDTNHRMGSRSSSSSSSSSSGSSAARSAEAARRVLASSRRAIEARGEARALAAAPPPAAGAASVTALLSNLSVTAPRGGRRPGRGAGGSAGGAGRRAAAGAAPPEDDLFLEDDALLDSIMAELQEGGGEGPEDPPGGSSGGAAGERGGRGDGRSSRGGRGRGRGRGKG